MLQLDGLIPSDDDDDDDDDDDEEDEDEDEDEEEEEEDHNDGDDGDCDADVDRMATVMLISKIANKNKRELPVNHHSSFRSKNDDFPTITSRFSAGSLLTKIPLPEKGSFQCGEKNVSKENDSPWSQYPWQSLPTASFLGPSIFDH